MGEILVSLIPFAGWWILKGNHTFFVDEIPVTGIRRKRSEPSQAQLIDPGMRAAER